ncbi:GumC family protein [Devosia sediminis]|uniref:non-specific protein-tyrosine kinase n=1 Tax=Devosia sediminis TaxID=2798801 RepID=A0A934IWC3_9HYPH|nr:polysaccharide biosynthesis tyrosine autokinase [Devosia sediminis]MBJ3783119.1 polysaccharide biosynthesis tyrosine autokinase [Devosia sediminis]
MDETEIDLRSIFGLLRRQFRLIVITVIAVVAIAATIAYTLTPSYTSTALILVDPSSKNLLDPDAQVIGGADNARIDSEVELVRSDNILLKVIQDEGLLADREVGVSLGLVPRILAFLRLAEPQLPTADEALNQALNQLRRAILVQRRGLTYLISVQASSVDPAMAARLANAVAEAYIADQLASKVNAALSSRDILQARIAQAREAIVSSENSYDTFISTNINRITQDAGRTDLASMQKQIAQLEAQRAQSSSIATAVQTALGANDLETIVTTLQSEALGELDRQRDELRARLEGTTAGSAGEVDLRSELAALEERMLTTANAEVNALRSSVQQSQTQEDELRQTLRSEVLNSSLSADVLTRLYELQQGSELARSQYQTLLARVQDLEAQANLQQADSRIVSPALAPLTPSFPNKTLILGLAVVAALGLGVALAFLYENLIGGFTSEAQVESVLRIPVATAVPRQRIKNERESLANLMVEEPLSVYSESIRRARAAIEQALRKRTTAPNRPNGKVIMVTSSSPNEGKTTVALSLARSYALSGQKTLLIDCDLRKPSVHRHLNLEPSQGLLDLLSSDSDSAVMIGSILSQDHLTPVTIVVGARRSDLPTDQLLSGPAFRRLIEAAFKSFDVIVLDTPPIGPVVDGLYIAPFADAVLYVVRWASSSQSDVRKSVASLSAATTEGTPIIAVLNQQDGTRSHYSRKYGSYYS